MRGSSFEGIPGPVDGFLAAFESSAGGPLSRVFRSHLAACGTEHAAPFQLAAARNKLVSAEFSFVPQALKPFN